MTGQQLGLMLLALALAVAAASWSWEWIRRRRRLGVVEEFLRAVGENSPRLLRAVGPCGHELPGYGTNVPTSCDLAAGHTGWHQDDWGTRWSQGTRVQEDSLSEAARLLHAHRHRAGTPPCDRCRADVEVLAPAFGWPA